MNSNPLPIAIPLPANPLPIAIPLPANPLPIAIPLPEYYNTNSDTKEVVVLNVAIIPQAEIWEWWKYRIDDTRVSATTKTFDIALFENSVEEAQKSGIAGYLKGFFFSDEVLAELNDPFLLSRPPVYQKAELISVPYYFFDYFSGPTAVQQNQAIIDKNIAALTQVVQYLLKNESYKALGLAYTGHGLAGISYLFSPVFIAGKENVETFFRNIATLVPGGKLAFGDWSSNCLLGCDIHIDTFAPHCNYLLASSQERAGFIPIDSSDSQSVNKLGQSVATLKHNQYLTLTAVNTVEIFKHFLTLLETSWFQWSDIPTRAQKIKTNLKGEYIPGQSYRKGDVVKRYSLYYEAKQDTGTVFGLNDWDQSPSFGIQIVSLFDVSQWSLLLDSVRQVPDVVDEDLQTHLRRSGSVFDWGKFVLAQVSTKELIPWLTSDTGCRISDLSLYHR